MIGTIINVCTIITGSVIGSVVRKGIKEEYSGALFTAMGLAAVALGINAIVGNMPNSDYPVLFIISLATGSLIGTICFILHAKSLGNGRACDIRIQDRCFLTFSVCQHSQCGCYHRFTYAAFAADNADHFFNITVLVRGY